MFPLIGNIIVTIILLSLAAFFGVPLLGYSLTYWKLVFL